MGLDAPEMENKKMNRNYFVKENYKNNVINLEGDIPEMALKDIRKKNKERKIIEKMVDYSNKIGRASCRERV